ncbi:hypothetical protein H8958_020548, partial [Nasalis larvatus]
FSFFSRCFLLRFRPGPVPYSLPPLSDFSRYSSRSEPNSSSLSRFLRFRGFPGLFSFCFLGPRFLFFTPNAEGSSRMSSLSLKGSGGGGGGGGGKRWQPGGLWRSRPRSWPGPRPSTPSSSSSSSSSSAASTSSSSSSPSSSSSSSSSDTTISSSSSSSSLRGEAILWLWP